MPTQNGLPFGTLDVLVMPGRRAAGQRLVKFTFFGGGLGGSRVSDGLNDGNPALVNRVGFGHRGALSEPPMGVKVAGIGLRAGQLVRIETPGGSGYGPPGARPPEAVRRDLRLGCVSPEAARQDYRIDEAKLIDPAPAAPMARA